MKIHVHYMATVTLFVWILCWIVAPGGAFAITLKQCIHEAQSNNTWIQSVMMESSASRARAKIALRQMLPRLETRYSYQAQRDPDSIKFFGTSFEISSRDKYQWDLILTQPIFHGGALLSRGEAANLLARAKREELKGVRNQIRFLVSKAFYSAIQARHLLEEAKAQETRLMAHLRLAEGFFQAELVTKNDVLEAKVQASQARQAVISAKRRLEVAKARLNQLMNRPVDRQLRLETDLDDKQPGITYEECVAIALASRPSLKAAAMAADAAKAFVKAQRGALFPSLDLVADYSKLGNTPDVSYNDYTDHDIAMIRLEARWDLWDWGITREKVAESSAMALRADALLEQTKQKAWLETKEAWLEPEAAGDRIEVARNALTQAEENYRLYDRRYREQLASSTDVLDAQALLTRARTSYFNALAQMKIAVAKLEYAIGSGDIADHPGTKSTTQE